MIRPDNEKGEGSGIGLAIVKSIGSTSRRAAGGIGRTLNAFYLIRAQTEKNDSDTSAE